jgi:hypothetical protein
MPYSGVGPLADSGKTLGPQLLRRCHLVTVPPMDLPLTLSTVEVAALLGCNGQVLSRAQNHDTPENAARYPRHASRVGRKYRWNANDVLAFMSGTR